MAKKKTPVKKTAKKASTKRNPPRKAVTSSSLKASRKEIIPTSKSKALSVKASRKPNDNVRAASTKGMVESKSSRNSKGSIAIPSATTKRLGNDQLPSAGKNDAKKVTKAKKRTATSQDPVQFVEEEPKLPKTWLNKKQLIEFKQLLLAKRGELAKDMVNLSRDTFSGSGSYGEHTSMPIHMADVGSDNWEREFALGLIENEQGLLREIDSALDRIENKTYGICLATHKPIGIARLRAKPWAKYCIEYARAREEGRAF